MAQPLLPQIKNIVFLMMENRSLDNVLGWAYRDGKPRHVFPASSAPAYDGLVAGRFHNPAYHWTWKGWEVKNYPVVPVPKDVAKAYDSIPWYDPYEEFDAGGWKGVMNQLFGNEKAITALPKKGTKPKMDGFLQDYYAKYMSAGKGWEGLDILWTFAPEQLPMLNGLARQYAISDHWFCSVPSQTNPNRAFSLCGTSLGRESNLHITAVEQFDVPTVFNAIADAGRTWGLYFTDTWRKGLSYTEYTFPQISKAMGQGQAGSLDDFYSQAATGSLPDFTYLEPEWGGGKRHLYVKQGTDYHPPTAMAPGDNFLRDVYNALRQSPQWAETLFIVTFDEHGGTYDHVAPPWGAINPDGKQGAHGFKFDLFGLRVPTLLISPFIEPGTVFRAPEDSEFPFDHTSFIKTILLWAGVDPNTVNLGRRMPKAPTFEGVLSGGIRNDGLSASQRHAAAPEAEALAPDVPPDGKSLATQFQGVDAACTRAILNRNDTAEGIIKDIETCKRDPDAFLASLS